MTVVRQQAVRRWAVVGAALALLCAAPVVVAAWPVPRVRVAPAVLRDRIRASADRPYQGYALSTASAGLPDLPRLGDVTALLDGTTQLRVWHATGTRWRADVIDTAGEHDAYQVDGRRYQWDYGANLLTRVVGSQPARLPRGADLSPPELARRLLGGAAGDRLSALAARRVAGVVAAGLRVVPADPDTTVGHVDIWAVPATGLPVRVDVTGKGSAAPVLVTRFLDLSTTAPPAAVLRPPAVGPGVGRTTTYTPDLVSALDDLGLGLLPRQLAGRPRTGPVPGVEGVSAYGAGLGQFIVVPVPRRLGYQALRAAEQGGAAELELPAGDGAVLGTALLTVAVLTAGHRAYLLAGMVDTHLLTQAATELSRYGP